VQYAASVSRLFFLILLWLALLPCSVFGEPVAVQDDLGRTLVFAKPPQRIVSISPGLTETLFALGLDDAIVGVSDFCNFPPAALAKPKVGGVTSNVEAIVALKPDLVLVTGGVATREFARRMDRLGISVMGFEADSVEAVFTRITLLGRITGRESSAAQLVAALHARLDAVLAARKPGPSPRVLYLVDEDPYLTVGPKSFLYDVLLKAGARPFPAGAAESYPRIGLEAIVRFDPEVIFFADDSEQSMAARVAAWRRWDRIAAVRAGRLFGIPRDFVNRPGPRIVNAVEFIAQKLHVQHEIPAVRP
jgi:iron complex transport system substrate-binding protein